MKKEKWENPQEKFMELCEATGNTENGKDGYINALLYLIERIEAGKISFTSISYKQTSEEEEGFVLADGSVSNYKRPVGKFYFTGETGLEIQLYDNEIARRFSHNKKEEDYYSDPEILDRMPPLPFANSHSTLITTDKWKELYKYIEGLQNGN